MPPCSPPSSTMPLHPLLSAEAMRAADAATLDAWGVPGRVLMETAGRALADAAERHALSPRGARRAVVLCGTGNNGGDGFVAARVLLARGWHIAVVSLQDDEDGDAGANLALLRRLADSAPLRFIGPGELDATHPQREPTDVIVDALLGIGATGALREPHAALAAWANAHPAPVVAADVPSGLDATTGAAADGTVRAVATVAFGALKTGLVLGDGPTLAGEVTVPEIGIPATEIEARATAHRADDAWVGAALPTRAADAHKYSAGTALCVVGSRAFSGAAVLSTGAALRAGAGAVRAAVPASVTPVLDAAHAEVMAEALAETDGGGLARRALDAIRQRLARADALLVGCGLGRDAETQALVRDLVLGSELPLVLDADGLHAFAGEADRLAERDGPLLLTPHLGELRVLLGDETFDPTDRSGEPGGGLVETVRELAARWDAVVLLKGMPSVVAAPDGGVRVGPQGEAALATAGTGDVLAGLSVGLAAQGLGLFDAATCALALGSGAARRWSHNRAPSSAGASDLLALVPAAWAALR